MMLHPIMVMTRFLGVCTTTGTTTEQDECVIRSLLNCTNPRMLCILVTPLGVQDSKVLQQNPDVHINCHIIYNTAQKVGETFSEVCGFNRIL